MESSAEVPYVSYTVNRPIGGESPKKKKTGKGAEGATAASTGAAGIARLRISERLQRSKHNTMVTVGKGRQQQQEYESESQDAAEDPELRRLKELPSFLPIMRATLSGHGAKDPDILERLDYRGLLSLVRLYDAHLRLGASTTAGKQAEIVRGVKECDQKICKVVQVMAERHKQYTQNAERLSRVNEMSKCLSKCHILLNENIEQLETLNNMLPQEDRLEPFVWTTG